jgi:hypothetical protein
MLVVFLSLAACGGPTISSETPSATTSVETTGEVPVSTPTEPPVITYTEPLSPAVTTETDNASITTAVITTYTITSPTTPTSTSTAPPPPPPDAADLTPFKIDGKSVFAVDTSSNDYREFKIKAGITNSGKTPAAAVTVNLYNTGNKIFSWDVETVGVGENIILETTVNDILSQSIFTPGKKSLNIDISMADSSMEIGGNNKSATENIIIASEPAKRRTSQSTTEKLIQDSIDNATWYTNANKNDLLTIAKDALKGAKLYWNSNQIEIMDFDKFNQTYSENYGENDQQKKSLKDWLEKNRTIGFGFIWGSTAQSQIILREGTLVQLLSPLFINLGELNYAQANYAGYHSGNEYGSVTLLAMLLEAYGFSILRDNFGFNGLTNISATIGSIPDLNLNNATMKRIWSMTGASDYLNGDVPSADLLKAYSTLLIKTDPVSYLNELDKNAESLDVATITNIVRWRLVNKSVTMLPEEIVTKIDPTKTSFSLDSLISFQNFVTLPW